MPLYEYQCPHCGRFETIRRFSDPPLEACPTCGRAIQKLLSAPAIQFKGTGWYVTDYARKGGNGGGSKGEGADAGASKSKEASSSPSKDSKKGGSAGSTSGSTGSSGSSS